METTHEKQTYPTLEQSTWRVKQMAEIRARLDAFKANVKANNLTWRQGLMCAMHGIPLDRAEMLATRHVQQLLASDPWGIYDGRAPFILVTRTLQARQRRIASARRATKRRHDRRWAAYERKMLCMIVRR